MEVEILKKDENHLEFSIDNLTLVELLRVYAWKNSAVEFAAWKRIHPLKPVIFTLKTKGKDAKAVLKEIIENIKKENNALALDFKKAVK